MAAFQQQDIVDAILGAQADNGAFASFVASRERTLEDRNGCITALVVRAIGHDPLPQRLHPARERALDWRSPTPSRRARPS